MLPDPARDFLGRLPSSRHPREGGDPSPGLAEPATFICDDCLTETRSAQRPIPAHWSMTAGTLRCPDCTATLATRSAR